MTWREKMALLFGTAAVFRSGDAAAMALPTEVILEADRPVVDRDIWVYTDPAARDRLLLLAGHRSHSSHSSHRSHYSGSGGHSSHSSHSSHYSGSTYTPSYTPAPVYTPPATRSVSPPKPPSKPSSSRTAGAGQPAPAGSAEQPLGLVDSATATDTTAASRPTKVETRDFIQKMQIALIVAGYDPGSADGVFGSQTREALRQFQAASGLPATGYMDVPSLRRLGVFP